MSIELSEKDLQQVVGGDRDKETARIVVSLSNFFTVTAETGEDNNTSDSF
jgi:bacteriocin-like protein